MNIELNYQGLKNELSPFNNCPLATLFKNCFSKTKTETSDYNLVICKDLQSIKNDISAINENQNLEISYDYLNGLEKSLPDVQFHYVVIYKQNIPILFTYFQLYSLNNSHLNIENAKHVSKKIVQFYLKIKKTKVLILGNALRNETCSVLYNNTHLSINEIAPTIIIIADRLAEEINPTIIVIKDLVGLPPIPKTDYINNGYQFIWDDNVMEMPIDNNWNTLNDYLQVLSRKYKTRANKTLAAAKNLSFVTLTNKEIAENKNQLNNLFHQVLQKQSFCLTKPGEDFFTDLSNVYKESFHINCFYLGTEMIAFYSVITTLDAYEIYYIGFKYELNTEYQLYFNILLSGLNQAIIQKKKVLKLGRTSFDAKASLGAKPKKLDFIIKLPNIPDFVINWFLKYFSSIEDSRWKQRNPLKTGESENN